MRRVLNRNMTAFAAVLILAAVGIAVGTYILAHQRLTVPGWVPVIGEEFFDLEVEIETAQGVMPGQGQTVNISGVRVGEVASVELEDGQAILVLRIEEQYADRLYSDADVLLRPKTNLKDMVVELDPGSPDGGERLQSGARLGIEATRPDVNFEAFLAALDADTREYLQILLGEGGRALGTGGGRDLANVFRRFAPLARDGAKASRLVAQRRKKLRRVMHNFSLFAEELGENDRQLANWVKGSAEVFRRFANQNENLAKTVELLPPALASTNAALSKIDTLGRSMEATLGGLRPAAKALAPSLRQMRPFFDATAPVIRDEIRPFTREARPIVAKVPEPAHDLAESTRHLRRFWDVFNAIVDELAYDPPGTGVGDQPYLFYLPWANHNTNSILSAQDGIGPLRRSLVYMNCGTLRFIESDALKRNATIQTLIQLLKSPSYDEVCRRRSSR